MRGKRVTMALLALYWLLSVHVSMAQEIQNDTEAVNVAGKQRMYTMRLLRDYLMIGEKINYRDPEGDLKKTMENFEASAKALRAYIKDPVLKTEQKEIQKMWESSRKMFSQAPKREDALVYAKAATQFRKKLNIFVNHLSEHYGSSSAKVVNAAGKLRAVSQALVSVYLLKSWDIPEAGKMIKRPMKSFRESLDFCDKAPETTSAMRPTLKKLENIYLFFQIMDEANSTTTPVLAIKKTDDMLKYADELTQMYVKALKK